MLKQFSAALARLIGLEANKTGHAEKLVSALGGLCGMLFVAIVSRHYLGSDAVWIIASMGASSVLLFAVPQGALSQPWPVLGGHTLAALIGISCLKYIPDTVTAGAAAVALTILAMHYLRCIHPPSGATALTPIIAGGTIQDLGYSYVITPVLFNVVLLLGFAVVFNFMFPWRRYPAGLSKYLGSRSVDKTIAASDDHSDIPSREHLEQAIRSLNKVVDIDEDDLEAIFRIAQREQLSDHLPADAILPGRFYSNGRHDARWQVRQVVDMPDADSPDALLIYKVVAGNNRRNTGTLTRSAFARWARHEVFLNENSWQRVDKPPA